MSNFLEVPSGAGGQPLPFSPAVSAGPFVFPVRPGRWGERRDRARWYRGPDGQTLKNVERALALAGCTMANVVKATVWLDDTRDF